MIVAFALTVLVPFGLLILYLVASQQRDLWTLARLTCTSCGRRLGRRVALAGRRYYELRCQQARQAEPTARINFIPHWRVQCPRCGARAVYDFQAGCLVDGSNTETGTG